jgi:transposase
MRAYSMDLRERVLRDSDVGLTSVAVAEKYDVSRAWVDRLKQRRRETGEVAPRAQRYGPHLKLGPHLHRLVELIREQPDRTLTELQEALGLSASLATIWRAVKRLGFTVKKNGARVRTRPARHRRRAAPVADHCADLGPRAPRLS